MQGVHISVSLLLPFALARTAIDRLGRVCAGRLQVHGGDGARSIIADIVLIFVEKVHLSTYRDLRTKSSCFAPFAFVLSKEAVRMATPSSYLNVE